MSSKNKTTREKILDASWQLLEQNQGKGVRMSDIAKQTGISRQALYLHFPTRADLLTATTRYLDEHFEVDARLAESRAASNGLERLSAFVDAWLNYIPEIFGVASALLAMKDSDEAARLAWDDRMSALREGCLAAVEALQKDGSLSDDYDINEATDILSAQLSVQHWEHLRQRCGWSQAKYVNFSQQMIKRLLLKA